ncbi:MAG: galactokinase [Terriglobales bacterium]
MSTEMGLWRAPGRINLIGEHTDYNDGWVMPAAIDLEVRVAITPRTGRLIRLHSEHFAATAEFSLDDRGREAGVPPWSRSLRGVALLLDRLSSLPGADLVLTSTIPVGAGLSSSAAAEVAVGVALAATAGLAIDCTALAKLCQQASHEFAGSRCGIMDQYIACHGRKGHFLQLDTSRLAARWLPWPDDACLLVCDTGVRHDNAGGEYNQRRAECEAAAARLGLKSLRELEPKHLERSTRLLPPELAARCRHVVSENARVLAAAEALQADDLRALGRILDASHASLRDDYQVSCPELDAMADLCSRQPGIYGARMMGGGFGGCVLALADPGALPALCQALPNLRLCRSADGAGAVARA